MLVEPYDSPSTSPRVSSHCERDHVIFSSPNVKEPAIGTETDGRVVIGRDHLSERHPGGLLPSVTETSCRSRVRWSGRRDSAPGEEAPRSPTRRMGDKTGAGVCRASRQRAFDRAGDAPPVKCGYEGVRVPRCHARFASNVERVVRSTRTCADISDVSRAPRRPGKILPRPAPRFLPTAAPPALNTPRRTA